MTTFVDDGLVEECLEDSASLPDFDECQIINLDDINAIIEDPGYILEEPLPLTGSKTEKNACSYGKRSFTLPVTFFDISRNVKLLTKCRPISVKIVDCRIYPWYYRKAKREKTEKCFSIKDKETNGETLNIDTDDLIIINSDDSSKTSSHLSDQSNVPKIYLSSEQSLVISKLKQGIEKISDVEKTYKNTNFNIDKDSTKTECNVNEAVARNISDKTIEDADLLKYKAIAETIVRNVDNLESDDVQFIKETEVYRESTFSKCIAAVNAEKPMNVTTNQNDKAEKIKDRIIISPILPKKIRSQKKTPTKRNNSKKPKIITANKQNLETCSNLSNSCDTSASKVIPHSHYRLPTPTEPAANHVYYMNLDRMISQYYPTQQYLEQTEAVHPQHQPINQVNYVTASNYSNFAYGQYGNRLTAPLNSEGHYLMNYRPTSGYEYDNTIYNMPQYENQQVIIKSNVEKITPPKPVHESSYGYINAINNSARQLIMENQNIVDVREKNVCRNNCRSISGHPSNNTSLFPHSMHPSNSYVNSISLQVPKRVTANIYNNPVLSQFLNKPIKPPNNYLSTQHFTKANSVTRPSVIQNTSGIVIHNDNNNTHSQFQPVHFNSLLSTMDYNNGKINKNVEQVKKSKVPSPNKKGEINTKSNSILKAPYNTAYTVYSGANFNPVYNIVNDTRRLNDRVATSSQTFRENISEFTKTINFGQEIDRAKVGPVIGKRDVNAKISGYSPAILPIPTFKKSLQMLSEMQKHNQIDATNEKNNFDDKKDNTFIHGESKVGRKRQHANDKNTYTKSKKISLQEYKQRILEAEKAGTKTDNKKQIDSTESLKSVDIKMQEEGCQNVDTQDLGYDSDCTVVLDILN